MKPNLRTSNLLITGSLLLAISFTSCVKDWRDGETDFSNVHPTVLIPEAGATGNAFAAAALTFPGTDEADTVYFHVNYAATTTAPTDETVTLGVDAQALTDFNNNSAIQYQLMPDSLYSFTTTQVTVKAGNNYSDAIPVIIYPSKIDPTQSYLLPISITDGPNGTIISGNQGTMYYHVIGNPLAGNYLQDFYRWNDVPDTTGPPNSTVFENQPVTIAPINATTLSLPESYLETFAGVGIDLTFTNNGGVLSNFAVNLSQTSIDALTAGGFTVNTAPILVSYQLVGNASDGYKGTTFRTYMEVTNSTGGNRKLVDNFVKQ